MIDRTLFNADHEAFRDSFRRFVDKEIAPHHAAWEEQGFVDREVWRMAGANGFLCMTMPETYGGAGVDKLYSVAQMEELSAGFYSGIGFGLHTEIGAIAMSEPAAGSDLQGVKTTAVRRGDHYVVSGSKTFITNGWHADLVIVVAKTDPAAGAKGTSLLIVERDMPGFERGQRLKKVGMKAQDTSELFFTDVQVPVDNLLGGKQQEGRGFICLMEQLPWERLQIAIGAVAAMQSAIDHTLAYVKERKVFGEPVGAYQNTRYKLAEMQSETQVARVFVDKCIELLLAGKLDTATASMAKYWCSELQNRVVDECVQLHGGYGYMWEYPVARAWADGRVQRIYGGTNEIMKEVISRSIGLPGR